MRKISANLSEKSFQLIQNHKAKLQKDDPDSITVHFSDALNDILENVS